MGWIIASVTVLLLFLYFLLAPIYLEINSLSGLCRVRFHRLASVGIALARESLFLVIRITWWEKRIDLFAPRKKEKGKEQKRKKVKKVKRRNVSFGKILSIIRSFQVKEFVLSIDTGNMQTNGMLYPVFYGLGRSLKRDITVNFNDRTDVRITIRNNAYRMLCAYIKS